MAVCRIQQFRSATRSARSLSHEIEQQVQFAANKLGLARVPPISIIPGQLSPLLWALGKTPRLFLPSLLWERLTPNQQTALLLHELAHLKRGDHWVRYLELVVTGLYWWHPVVWWSCQRLREAEEQCCDAWVVWALPDKAPDYAAALVATV